MVLPNHAWRHCARLLRSHILCILCPARVPPHVEGIASLSKRVNVPILKRHRSQIYEGYTWDGFLYAWYYILLLCPVLMRLLCHTIIQRPWLHVRVGSVQPLKFDIQKLLNRYIYSSSLVYLFEVRLGMDVLQLLNHILQLCMAELDFFYTHL